MPARIDQLLTAEQVADCLQLRVETVYRYIKEGRLRAIRLGRAYRLERQELERFLALAATGSAAGDAPPAKTSAPPGSGQSVVMRTAGALRSRGSALPAEELRERAEELIAGERASN